MLSYILRNIIPFFPPLLSPLIAFTLHDICKTFVILNVHEFVFASQGNACRHMRKQQEPLRSTMVWDLCSVILFSEIINHMKSTGSALLQRPLFYSSGAEVISRAAAIVCIIDLLTPPDKIQWHSHFWLSIKQGNKGVFSGFELYLISVTAAPLSDADVSANVNCGRIVWVPVCEFLRLTLSGWLNSSVLRASAPSSLAGSEGYTRGRVQ